MPIKQTRLQEGTTCTSFGSLRHRVSTVSRSSWQAVIIRALSILYLSILLHVSAVNQFLCRLQTFQNYCYRRYMPELNHPSRSNCHLSNVSPKLCLVETIRAHIWTVLLQCSLSWIEILRSNSCQKSVAKSKRERRLFYKKKQIVLLPRAVQSPNKYRFVSIFVISKFVHRRVRNTLSEWANLSHLFSETSNITRAFSTFTGSAYTSYQFCLVFTEMNPSIITW